jgi:hypothetical protein
MSPPAQQRAEKVTPNALVTPHVAPLIRGADGAARRPYQEQFENLIAERARPVDIQHESERSSAW